jgi:hypothetical protein
MNDAICEVKRQALLEEFHEIMAFLQTAFQARAPKGVEPPSTGQRRTDTKKMALVGATYTVDRFMRTPDEVLDALFQDAGVDEPPPSRPRPCFKYVRAALQRDERDSTEPQVQTLFGWMAEQVAQRHPDGNQQVVLLMGGQDSLWRAGWAYLPEGLAEVSEILDLLHALGYLWEATHLFHPKGSDAARDDRLERSGMRWVMSGARAMLDMRCIYLSGLWEEFTAFRIQPESRRLYPGYDMPPTMRISASHFRRSGRGRRVALSCRRERRPCSYWPART